MTLGQFRANTKDLPDSIEIELVMDSEHYTINAISTGEQHMNIPHYAHEGKVSEKIVSWEHRTTPLVRLYI